MLEELFNLLVAVPSVNVSKNQGEPLQAGKYKEVPSVPPVLPQKTEVKDKVQDRYSDTHAAVKAFYLKHGKTEVDWERVNHNPVLFNRVWNMMLGMPPSDKPPMLNGQISG